MGRVFRRAPTPHSVTCKDESSKLTYSLLTDYYNELVLQLKLAEHNFKVAIDLEIEEAIDLEIEEVNRSESLAKEHEIIKLLNESILPALEFTVS